MTTLAHRVPLPVHLAVLAALAVAAVTRVLGVW